MTICGKNVEVAVAGMNPDCLRRAAIIVGLQSGSWVHNWTVGAQGKLQLEVSPVNFRALYIVRKVKTALFHLAKWSAPSESATMLTSQTSSQVSPSLQLHVDGVTCEAPANYSRGSTVIASGVYLHSAMQPQMVLSYPLFIKDKEVYMPHCQGKSF
ncbi:hypothetical protein AOLI_G00058130 [Acnodon oligacanthus]